MKTFVVYFDQDLGAAYFKHWQKYAIFTFLTKGEKKASKLRQNWGKYVYFN